MGPELWSVNLSPRLSKCYGNRARPPGVLALNHCVSMLRHPLLSCPRRLPALYSFVNPADVPPGEAQNLEEHMVSDPKVSRIHCQTFCSNVTGPTTLRTSLQIPNFLAPDISDDKQLHCLASIPSSVTTSGNLLHMMSRRSQKLKSLCCNAVAYGQHSLLRVDDVRCPVRLAVLIRRQCLSAWSPLRSKNRHGDFLICITRHHPDLAKSCKRQISSLQGTAEQHIKATRPHVYVFQQLSACPPTPLIAKHT